METGNEFNGKDVGADAGQFRIEAADGDRGRFFSVRPLGNERYELLDDDGSIGTIQLDERDHSRCESQGCELDLPLLHSVRDQIRGHLDRNKDMG
ncbi:MAG: hypothetical protein REI78_02865 [Pedobacter sp.]|nr:hypothetical protein [Pedobacter sp.]